MIASLLRRHRDSKAGVQTARRLSLALESVTGAHLPVVALVVALAGCGSASPGDGEPAANDAGHPVFDGSTLAPDGSSPSPDAQAADAGLPPGDAGSEGGISYASFDAGPILPVIGAGPADDWQALDNAALNAFGQMYATSNGQWTTGPRWSFANDVEATEASFARSGGQNFLDLIVATYDLNSAGQFLDDLGYDDEAWWAIAWVRGYDLTGNPTYLAAAKTIFTDMTTAWDTAVCSGGIWWNRNRNYKNAITNELVLLLGARLHTRPANDSGPGSYLDWANKEWDWFSGSGMINGSNLINDGLTPGADAAVCTNNGQTTWTYNQGVVLGGLAEMYEATGDATWLSRAEPIADAAISKLADANGVMQEPCGSGGCNSDQAGFKGIFVRNLVHLYDQDRKPSYFDFITVNARSAWANDRDPNSEFDINWAGPFAATSAPPQNSAMFALSALADPISLASAFLRPAAHPSFNHAVGARDSVLGWACDPATCPSAGLMQSGPYVSYLPLGAHTAHFRASVGATSSRTDPLATFDVYDTQSSAVLATKSMAWSDFVEANVTQDVAVPYTQPTAGDPVEYRVTWLAASGAPRLVLTDVGLEGEQSFTGSNLAHECGQLDGAWQWSLNRFAEPAPCLATNGPGLTLPAGDYVATFELRVDEFALDDAAIATLSVVDHDSGSILGTLALTRSQFTTTQFQTFAVPFHAVGGRHLDIQTLWSAAATAPRTGIRGVYVRHKVTETPVTLPFNQRGIGATPGDGAIDDVGSALASTLLGPGLDVAFDSFTFGSAGNNVLQGGGAAVPLVSSGGSGPVGSVELLGFAINGAQTAQSFTLGYGDGTSQSVVRSLSDWTGSTPLEDERIALAMPYRWSKTAKEYGNFHLFLYSLPVDGSRMLATVTLPPNANVKVLAMTLVSP